MKYRYPGIHAFSAENTALFCGRKTDEDRFYSLLRLERLVVLYGKSGYGKTSLLQAAVLPRLERETDYVALLVRFRNYAPGFPTPVGRTAEIISEWLPQQKITHKNYDWLNNLLPGNDSLWYHLKRAQALTGRKRFVLVFDQFEELFSYPDSVALQFRAQLAELLYTRIPQDYRDAWNRLADSNSTTITQKTAESFFFDDLDIRAVFSLRTDYMHYMNRMKDYLPLILRHCYELDALTFDQAREAIIEPAGKTGLVDYTPPFAYSEEMVNLLLEYLSNKRKEKIESFQLQLICHHIENELVEKKGKTSILPSDFGPNNNAQIEYFRQVNRGYYQSCIKAITPLALQNVARQFIENELIIPNEKRRATVDGGILISRYAEQGATEDLLEQLKNTYLVRAEKSERGALYELSHDALIEPLLRARDEREQRELRNRRRKERLLILLLTLFLGGIALTFIRLWANAERLALEKSNLATEKTKLADSLGVTLIELDSTSAEKARLMVDLQQSYNTLIQSNLRLANSQVLSLDYENCHSNLRTLVRELMKVLPEGADRDSKFRVISEVMIELCFFYIETGNYNKGIEILVEIGRLNKKPEVERAAQQLLQRERKVKLRSAAHEIMKAVMPDQFRFLWKRYYPVMLPVAGGRYTMGCDPMKERDCHTPDGESSEHEVRVADFKMAESETTIWQFNLFKTATNEPLAVKEKTLGDHPCGYVSLVEAALYADWVSRQNNLVPAYSWLRFETLRGETDSVPEWKNTKTGYRLPTEAEWELAARGGIAGLKDNFRFSGSKTLDSVGWNKDNTAPSGIPSPKAVKTRQPNRLGLYDMSGNLSEWCWDMLPNRRTNMKNDRVCKGGSFRDLERKCVVFNRDQYNESAPPNEAIGFRVVCH
ncbi:MAG: SUMF1/EgtB/PvdO family nonheme iron enzyme [Saprospiraceae bacterium]|nr:SUMF1/EgtB/PvdO family nonheme iron enzyme [Saprospiraceae bacterium]